MSHYRGYFMKDDHIVAPASIEAADDAQALRKASALLTTSHFGIEVWHGFRLAASTTGDMRHIRRAGSGGEVFPRPRRTSLKEGVMTVSPARRSHDEMHSRPIQKLADVVYWYGTLANSASDKANERITRLRCHGAS